MSLIQRAKTAWNAFMSRAPTAENNYGPTMTNYYSRTIEPWLCAIVDELTRKFLSKTARTQRQRIMFFRNPFKLVPVSVLPDMADKLTRNEIVSSNEIRQVIGLKPSDDPDADELRNKNLNKSTEEMQQSPKNQNTEPSSEEESSKTMEFKKEVK